MQGKVISFYEEKGFGFIYESFKVTRFFHVSDYHSGIVPRPGMLVQYTLTPSRRYPGVKPDQAIFVTPVQQEVGGTK